MLISKLFFRTKRYYKENNISKCIHVCNFFTIKRKKNEKKQKKKNELNTAKSEGM